MANYIQAINNLKNNSFSRDCYFYYVVPEDQQKLVAEHFKDATWLTFVNLETFQERLVYQKIMCRKDESDTDSDDDLTDDAVTASDTVSNDDSGDHRVGWIGLSPWFPPFTPYKIDIFKRPLLAILGGANGVRMFLIVLLLAILLKLNLNHY